MLDSWDDAMLGASVDRLNVKGMSDNFFFRIFFLHNKNSAEGSVPPVRVITNRSKPENFKQKITTPEKKKVLMSGFC